MKTIQFTAKAVAYIIIVVGVSASAAAVIFFIASLVNTQVMLGAQNYVETVQGFWKPLFLMLIGAGIAYFVATVKIEAREARIARRRMANTINCTRRHYDMTV